MYKAASKNLNRRINSKGKSNCINGEYKGGRHYSVSGRNARITKLSVKLGRPAAELAKLSNNALEILLSQ